MTGPIKRFRAPLSNVKTTLSELACFQTLTGSANATEALEYIHDFAGLDDGTDKRPRIILDIDSYQGRRQGGRFVGPVQVLVLHEYNIPTAYQTNVKTQAAWFWDQIEDWFDEFESVVYGGGQLSVEVIEMTMSPALIEPDDIGGAIVWATQFRMEVRT